MPYPFYYGFDWTYLAIVLPCLLIAMLTSANVNRTFKRYSEQLSSRHITGAQAAMRVLQSCGVTNVRIERVSGNLTDHYDPKANVIRLSDSVHDSTSTAAIGVACHEAGHAVQYANNYFPIKIRAVIIPITNIGSKLAMPLILIGLIIPAFADFSYVLVDIGIACFALSMLFQLITLPVEINASRRAMRTIEDTEILTEDEQIGAKKTLRAAALTYVAATIVALAQLFRLIFLFGGRRRND